MPPIAPRDVVLFVILSGLLAAGWRRERRRARAGETQLAPLLQALFLVASVGGAFGALIWFVLVPGTFPWILPPLAQRFLSAAAAAFALGCALALWRGRLPEARLFLAVTAGYFAPLLVTLPLHLDRLNILLPVTWGFLLAGVGLFALAVWGLAIGSRAPSPDQGISVAGVEAECRQRVAIPNARHAAWPAMVSWTRVLVAVIGLATLILGLAMVVAPESSPAFWPWVWEVVPGPPLDIDGLTHRLIAVMFIGLATGAAFTVWQGRRDVAEVYLAMLAAYAVVGALGVLLFVARFPTTPTMWAYLGILVAIAMCSLVALQANPSTDAVEHSPAVDPAT